MKSEIKILKEQLRVSEEQYLRLWNQHKLLRLSYRSLKQSLRGSVGAATTTSEVQPATLNETFTALLYGRRNVAHLRISKSKKREKNRR